MDISNTVVEAIRANGVAIAELRSQSTAQGVAIAELRSQSTAQGVAIAELRSQSTAQGAAIAELRSQSTAQGVAIAELRSEFTAQSVAIAEFRSEFTDAIRAQGVLFEQLRSQMVVVIEAVTLSSERLDAKIDALDKRLSDRIAVLEDAVRQNSRDIHFLRIEITRLRHDFDHREERGRVVDLEVRVSAIEARLGIKPL